MEPGARCRAGAIRCPDVMWEIAQWPDLLLAGRHAAGQRATSLTSSKRLASAPTKLHRRAKGLAGRTGSGQRGATRASRASCARERRISPVAGGQQARWATLASSCKTITSCSLGSGPLAWLAGPRTICAEPERKATCGQPQSQPAPASLILGAAASAWPAAAPRRQFGHLNEVGLERTFRFFGPPARWEQQVAPAAGPAGRRLGDRPAPNRPTAFVAPRRPTRHNRRRARLTKAWSRGAGARGSQRQRPRPRQRPRQPQRQRQRQPPAPSPRLAIARSPTPYAGSPSTHTQVLPSSSWPPHARRPSGSLGSASQPNQPAAELAGWPTGGARPAGPKVSVAPAGKLASGRPLHHAAGPCAQCAPCHHRRPLRPPRVRERRPLVGGAPPAQRPAEPPRLAPAPPDSAPNERAEPELHYLGGGAAGRPLERMEPDWLAGAAASAKRAASLLCVLSFRCRCRGRADPPRRRYAGGKAPVGRAQQVAPAGWQDC